MFREIGVITMRRLYLLHLTRHFIPEKQCNRSRKYKIASMIHAELPVTAKANTNTLYVSKIRRLANYIAILKVQNYYKTMEIGITLLTQASFHDAILNSTKHHTKPCEL